MVEKLYAENKLLVGIDAGNTSTKSSFLDKEGNISDFSISTIVAPAPTQAIVMKDRKASDVSVESFLHIRIKTDALDGAQKDSTWYVGEYAKDKKGNRQPHINEKGESEEKFSGDSKPVFVIPLLTSIAVAALKSGKEKVEVPLSTGLPVETYSLREQKLLDVFYGTHEIVFLDGPFKNEVVVIQINEGEIQQEAVTTSIALEFTIKNGECVGTEIGKVIGDKYAIGDLGAGTSDVAVFSETGVSKTDTHNTKVGTNQYIDLMIKEISELEVFEDVRSALEEDAEEVKPPFHSREKFVNQIIKPQIDKALVDDSLIPKFVVSWGWVKNVDVTEIVVKYMSEYAQKQKKSLLSTWAKLDEAEHFLLVGGGVLFGYFGGVNSLEKVGFKFPSLKESQYFTSRAYLIASYLTQWEKSLATQQK